MRLYKSYMFRSKDPAIDELRTLLQDHYGGPKLGQKIYKDIEEAGGPAVGTLRGWFHGKTKRPQNASLEATGRAVGFKRVWVKDK